MTRDTTPRTRRTEESQRNTPQWSRRGFLRTTAATATLVGLGGVAAAQETTFRLGGDTAGWEGRAPASIEGQTNPTLNLEAGTEYEVVWENVDGQPHNFAILDAEDNSIMASEIISEEGATQRVTFTAEEQMAAYRCDVHPQTMLGSIEFGGGAAGNATNATNVTGNETNVTGNATNETNVTAGNETNVTGDNETNATDNVTNVTGNATETTTTTEAAAGNETGGDGGTTPSDGQPGFGVVATLAGLAGGAAWLARRKSRRR